MSRLGSSGTATSGNQTPDLGGYDFFANGAWWQAIGSPASEYGIDPNSASLVSAFGTDNIQVDFSTTTANGGDSIYGIPYNVVPANQPLVPIELGIYANQSSPGPVPFYTGMSIENVAAGLTPPLPAESDQHGLVMVENPATGGIAYLYDGYQVSWDSTNDEWAATQLTEYNMLTGAPPPEFDTTEDAAGLPLAPLLTSYSEAALAASGGPAIDHPLYVSISEALSMDSFVWPARHGVSSGSATTGLPMGARLQLTQAWYDANINNFDPIDKAIVTAMYQYGVIVADLSSGGGMWLEGVNDQRWTTAELNALGTIPDSAFQVLNTIQPAVNFTGPTIGQVGVPQTYTITYPNTADSNFNTQLWVEVSTNGGASWTYIDEYVLDDANRGPFTFSYTPAAAGSYVFQVNYGGNDWILPPPIDFSATTTAVGQTITSTENGNWSNPATWGGQSPPGPGDYAVIDNNVTITQNTTIGDGTDSVVLNVTTGTLTVVGATLVIQGDATFGQYNSGNTVWRLVVESTATAPGGIVLGANTGVTPTVSFGDDTGLEVTGTAAEPCYLETETGTAGNPGQFTYGGTSSSFFANISYCDLTGLGDANYPGLNSPYLGADSDPVFTFSNDTFNDCAATPTADLNDGSIDFSLTNSTWVNSIGWSISITGDPAAPVTTGTREINDCIFDESAQLLTPIGLSITDNFFEKPPTAGAETATWASFDGNFVLDDDGGGEHQFGGNVTNSYFLANPTTEGGETDFILTAQYANSLIADNVFQYTGVEDDATAIGITEAGPNSRTITINNNIILPTGTVGSLRLGGLTSNSGTAWTEYTSITNNTIFVNNTSAINDGYTVGTKTGTVLSLSSNIFYNTSSASSGDYAFENVAPTPVPVDVVSAADANYNGWYNLGTVPVGTWGDVADGTVYDSPMSGSTPPGANDLVNANPDFVAPTRNIETWDAYMGGPGTIADALNLIEANLGLTKSSLLPYIQAGFVPTNPAFAVAGAVNGYIGAMPVSVAAPAAAIVASASSQAVAAAQPAGGNVTQTVTVLPGTPTAGGTTPAPSPSDIVATSLATTSAASAPKTTTTKAASPPVSVTVSNPSSHPGSRPKNVRIGMSSIRRLRSNPNLAGGGSDSSSSADGPEI